jgi:hypothetical protein
MYLKFDDGDYIKCLNINFKLKLWNIINSIRGSDWYITIMVWKIYNGKIEVISFMSFFCPKAHQNIYNCQRLLRGGIKCYTWSVANPQNLASDQEFWWCSDNCKQKQQKQPPLSHLLICTSNLTEMVSFLQDPVTKDIKEMTSILPL